MRDCWAFDKTFHKLRKKYFLKPIIAYENLMFVIREWMSNLTLFRWPLNDYI